MWAVMVQQPVSSEVDPESGNARQGSIDSFCDKIFDFEFHVWNVSRWHSKTSKANFRVHTQKDAQKFLLCRFKASTKFVVRVFKIIAWICLVARARSSDAELISAGAVRAQLECAEK